MCDTASKINPDSYITIHGWMVTELGLTGNDLIVYALIYGFSQGDERGFLGSQSYIAEWLKRRREAANRAVGRLERKGLVVKVFTEDGCILYVARRPCAEIAHPPVQKSHTPCAEIAHPPVQKSHTPCAEIAHNNNIYINNTNIDISNSSSSVCGTTTTTTPSVEEVADYFREQGYTIDPQRFWDVNQLREWKNKQGKPLDWKVVARLWEAKEKKAKEKETEKESSFDTDDFWQAAVRRTYDV